MSFLKERIFSNESNKTTQIKKDAVKKVLSTACMEGLNERLIANHIPLKLYRTNKLLLIRIKQTLENGNKRTLRNGVANTGSFYTNQLALYYIAEVLEEC